MRSSRRTLRLRGAFHGPLSGIATALALTLLLLAPVAAVAESAPARPERPASRLATRADSVLAHLQADRADLAWEATAQWTDVRNRPLTPEIRRREAVRTAIRLRDTGTLRHAAAFAAEIDQHLAAAAAAMAESSAVAQRDPKAMSDLAQVLDLRAAIAAGFRMDTARARDLRVRSAELAPERLPKRLGTGTRPGPASGESTTETGGAR